jgi:CPA1 family monovalent cation:H+ antiporter
VFFGLVSVAGLSGASEIEAITVARRAWRASSLSRLFLLLGLEVFAVQAGPTAILASVLVIPVVLAARLASVSVPIAAMSLRNGYTRGLIPMLTWSGLRGGISVAMVLSLPRFPAREYLLACCYGVVVFSILVQGLTVRRVLVHYGVGETIGA